MRRHNILREPTPTPTDADEEDSGTTLLKNKMTLAAFYSYQDAPVLDVADAAKCNFLRCLDLLPSDQDTINGRGGVVWLGWV